MTIAPHRTNPSSIVPAMLVYSQKASVMELIHIHRGQRASGFSIAISLLQEWYGNISSFSTSHRKLDPTCPLIYGFDVRMNGVSREQPPCLL